MRLLGATWRVRWTGALPDGACVIASLHENLMPLIVAMHGLDATPMLSRSGDGELLAEVSRRLGYRVLRGSSSRGGREALEAAVDLARQGGRPGFAVDGPRGPRGEPKPGAVVAAIRAQVPLIALRVRARPALRLRSWDRSCVPLPFARVELEPVPVRGLSGGVEAGLDALRAALAPEPGS
ncbi:MAG: DUF374 domain-containing protein [Alphaproteobacteria bacterium]|nr:DUF374 domain-containing protein [Alphaproteobacteria bacterium]MCB9791610.1 DUF374 domain-containing protein [Alphaproteobacteria bacterium]